MDPVAFVREFGAPVSMLLMIGYGAYQIAMWTAREVIVPLRDRHFAFLSELERTLDTLAKTQSQMGTELSRVSTTFRCFANGKESP